MYIEDLRFRVACDVTACTTVCETCARGPIEDASSFISYLGNSNMADVETCEPGATVTVCSD